MGYLTGQEIVIMCHMLGIKRHDWSYKSIELKDRYRNYWAADIPETRFDRLIEVGFVKSYRRNIMTSQQIGFTVTQEGYTALFDTLVRIRWSVRNNIHRYKTTKFYMEEVNEELCHNCGLVPVDVQFCSSCSKMTNDQRGSYQNGITAQISTPIPCTNFLVQDKTYMEEK